MLIYLFKKTIFLSYPFTLHSGACTINRNKHFFDILWLWCSPPVNGTCMVIFSGEHWNARLIGNLHKYISKTMIKYITYLKYLIILTKSKLSSSIRIVQKYTFSINWFYIGKRKRLCQNLVLKNTYLSIKKEKKLLSTNTKYEIIFIKRTTI